MIPSGKIPALRRSCRTGRGMAAHDASAPGDRDGKFAALRQNWQGRAEADRAFNVSLKGGQGLPSSRLERLCWGAVGSAFTRFLMHGRNQSKNRKYVRVSSWKETREGLQTRRSMGSSRSLDLTMRRNLTFSNQRGGCGGGRSSRPSGGRGRPPLHLVTAEPGSRSRACGHRCCTASVCDTRSRG